MKDLRLSESRLLGCSFLFVFSPASSRRKIKESEPDDDGEDAHLSNSKIAILNIFTNMLHCISPYFRAKAPFRSRNGHVRKI
jgi:hypothetical protein